MESAYFPSILREVIQRLGFASGRNGIKWAELSMRIVMVFPEYLKIARAYALTL